MDMYKSPASMFGWKINNLNFQKLALFKDFTPSDLRTNLDVIIAFL